MWKKERVLLRQKKKLYRPNNSTSSQSSWTDRIKFDAKDKVLTICKVLSSLFVFPLKFTLVQTFTS